MLYADLGVPKYLEPVFSWPPRNFADCGECFQVGCTGSRHWFLNVEFPRYGGHLSIGADQGGGP